MGPLGTDIDAVKKQIDQLKKFKSEVDPHMVKVEALNRSVFCLSTEIELYYTYQNFDWLERDELISVEIPLFNKCFRLVQLS